MEIFDSHFCPSSNPPPHPTLGPIWHQPPAPGSDPVIRASQYLRQVRQGAPQPDWIAMANSEDQFLAVLTWMGWHIHQLNQRLSDILADMMGCLQPQDRPNVAIFAAPIAAKVGVDGFCNLQRQPIVVVIDPSRVMIPDWPHLVAHELAHAIAGTTGHGPSFHSALSHLCLAQDLPLPPAPQPTQDWLRYWPPCRPNPQAEQFWLGAAAS